MNLAWIGIRVSSSQIKSLHSDTFNLFAEHCSPVNVSYYTYIRGILSLQKDQNGQPLPCSPGSKDVLKACEEFSLINLEPGRLIGQWMAGFPDQLPLAVGNFIQQ